LLALNQIEEAWHCCHNLGTEECLNKMLEKCLVLMEVRLVREIYRELKQPAMVFRLNVINFIFCFDAFRE
jgi:hypothetical protein